MYMSGAGVHRAAEADAPPRPGCGLRVRAWSAGCSHALQNAHPPRHSPRTGRTGAPGANLGATLDERALSIFAASRSPGGGLQGGSSIPLGSSFRGHQHIPLGSSLSGAACVRVCVSRASCPCQAADGASAWAPLILETARQQHRRPGSRMATRARARTRTSAGGLHSTYRPADPQLSASFRGLPGGYGAGAMSGMGVERSDELVELQVGLQEACSLSPVSLTARSTHCGGDLSPGAQLSDALLVAASRTSCERAGRRKCAFGRLCTCMSR